MISTPYNPDDQTTADGEEKDLTVPLSKGLVTLSTLSKSRWHNLSQLDIIKVHRPTKVLKTWLGRKGS